MKLLIAFLRGVLEFRRSFTWADTDENRDLWGGYTDLDEAYDRGREFAHRVTFRRFEDGAA